MADPRTFPGNVIIKGTLRVNGSITGIGSSTTFTSPILVGTPVINTIKGVASTATVSAGYSTDTYLAGSGIAMPTGGFVALARYTCKFDMVKTGAGTATPIVVVRIGAGAAVTDAAILTFTFAVGTGVVDTGTFEIDAHFRTVGTPTAAVMVGGCTCIHALAATGLTTTGASGSGMITGVVSSGFDSTTAGTTIGVSFNGGASFSGTNTWVRAELNQY